MLLMNFKVIILITLHVLDYINLVLKELFYQCHRTEKMPKGSLIVIIML